MSLTVTRLAVWTRPFPAPPDRPDSPKHDSQAHRSGTSSADLAETVAFMRTPQASCRPAPLNVSGTAARPRLAARTTRKKRAPWESS